MNTGCQAIDDSTAKWVIGSDEAGLGTWAGDLIVAAVAVLRTWDDPEVTDSKKLSDGARKAAVRKYKNSPGVYCLIDRTSPQDVDKLGVNTAVKISHTRLHKKLLGVVTLENPETSILHVVDGFENARSWFQSDSIIPLTKADTKVPAVSLASCFAKVTQCVLMDKAHAKYPQYGFNNHRGYGTSGHQAALASYGVCPLHRRSYRPIKKLLIQNEPDILDLSTQWDSPID